MVDSFEHSIREIFREEVIVMFQGEKVKRKLKYQQVITWVVISRISKNLGGRYLVSGYKKNIRARAKLLERRKKFLLYAQWRIHPNFSLIGTLLISRFPTDVFDFSHKTGYFWHQSHTCDLKLYGQSRVLISIWERYKITQQRSYELIFQSHSKLLFEPSFISRVGSILMKMNYSHSVNTHKIYERQFHYFIWIEEKVT